MLPSHISEQMKSTRVSETMRTENEKQALKDTLRSSLQDSQRQAGLTDDFRKDKLRVETLRQKMDTVLVCLYFQDIRKLLL